MAMQTGPGGKVDRQKTTPFHLKLFYRTGAFHRLEDFPSASGPLPPHLQIYTWPSCTLRELSHLLVSALPNLIPDPAIGTRLAYRLVFPDTRDAGRPGAPGRFLSKELGNVIVGGDGPGMLPSEEEATVVTTGAMAGELQGEPDKTLQDARFVIGDYISCAVFPPLANGAVAPPPLAGGAGRPGAVGGRGMGDFGGGGGGGGGGRGGGLGGPRENGYGGFRGRGGQRGGGVFNGGRVGDGGLPSGEWRRGERIPDGPGGRGYGRGRGRGY